MFRREEEEIVLNNNYNRLSTMYSIIEKELARVEKEENFNDAEDYESILNYLKNKESPTKIGDSSNDFKYLTEIAEKQIYFEKAYDNHSEDEDELKILLF